MINWIKALGSVFSEREIHFLPKTPHKCTHRGKRKTVPLIQNAAHRKCTCRFYTYKSVLSMCLSMHPSQESDGEKSDDNLVVDVSNEV